MCIRDSRIVGTLSNTFYKPVTSDTIFVASNTRDKHTNLDEMAVQTFYLTNISQPNDGNEIQNAVRALLPVSYTHLPPPQAIPAPLVAAENRAQSGTPQFNMHIPPVSLGRGWNV